MSLYDFFHKMFDDGRNFRSHGDDQYGFKKPEEPTWDLESENDDFRDFDTVIDLNKMMTDAFKMHQIFDQKMNEILQSFSSPGDILGTFVFESPHVPSSEEKHKIRDYYFKSGLNEREPNKDNAEEHQEKTSQSITSWQDRFFPKDRAEVEPFQGRVFSSFKSVTRRTVTLPDGTIKTEEIIRNSDGTEQKTETQTLPGEHSPFTHFSIITPDISTFFGQPRMPETDTATLRDQLLKPGYEKFNPGVEKVDMDLDKQILQSGVESLPSFSKEPSPAEPNHNFSFRSFTKKTVTLPNGAVESEEVVRNSDGTEQRTVTQMLADGTTSTITGEGSNKSTYPGSIQDDQTLLINRFKGLLDFFLK